MSKISIVPQCSWASTKLSDVRRKGHLRKIGQTVPLLRTSATSLVGIGGSLNHWFKGTRVKWIQVGGDS
jgi:hypothetical protein